ncbi:MAG: nucleotidyltransferase family protein [Candidatus Omnitrophica bacterium]|nr:nucleotidyltransferase family protein [Candidatus Omnitrophota bacterium]MDD5355563.1 nucleotidyltransferase family protein [Candidatus Omnitrophota bacterium]
MSSKSNFSAIILAGGYATRLYPITLDASKPLLKIDKRAIIDFSIHQLKDIEAAKEIIVVTNEKFFGDYIKWKKKLRIKKKVTIVNDKTRTDAHKLGAVGDIYYAIRKRKITNDVLVIGGDNIFEGRLPGFVNFAKNKSPSISIGVYDLKSRSMASRYGVVKLEKNNRVLEFKEKPRRPQSAIVAMCMYYFPKETLAYFREYIKDLGRDTDRAGDYIKWLMIKRSLYGFKFSGAWWDIGQLDAYHKAQRYFSKKNK